MSFEPIENYGVIGNMCSIALVSVNGSIDFLCYPNFDSPTVFAALLDDEKGGSFEIQPATFTEQPQKEARRASVQFSRSIHRASTLSFTASRVSLKAMEPLLGMEVLCVTRGAEACMASP